MELRYIQAGDYYIPDIKLSYTSEKPLGSMAVCAEHI